MTYVPSSRRLDIARHALFLDVDGTLAQIQPRPELVFIPAHTLQALQRWQAHGAPVAVVSGRPLHELDGLLSPLRLPAAGVHGAERRTADGQVQRISIDASVLCDVETELQAFCQGFPGLRLESKGIAFALHYRQAPEWEDVARRQVESLAARYPEVLKVQPGKCVFELKPKGASKGEVIRHFMQEPPFAGRVPVFIGDDLTDEAGFEVVNALGGLSIKVGEGDSRAQMRLDSVEAVADWLGEPSAAHSLKEERRPS
jgi:trehalose 6-phosphate phosphatase